MSETDCHDAETLVMARSIVNPLLNHVQVALNDFWARFGEPSPVMVQELQRRMQSVAGEILHDYFPDIEKK